MPCFQALVLAVAHGIADEPSGIIGQFTAPFQEYSLHRFTALVSSQRAWGVGLLADQPGFRPGGSANGCPLRLHSPDSPEKSVLLFVGWSVPTFGRGRKQGRGIGKVRTASNVHPPVSIWHRRINHYQVIVFDRIIGIVVRNDNTTLLKTLPYQGFFLVVKATPYPHYGGWGCTLTDRATKKATPKGVALSFIGS